MFMKFMHMWDCAHPRFALIRKTLHEPSSSCLGGGEIHGRLGCNLLDVLSNIGHEKAKGNLSLRQESDEYQNCIVCLPYRFRVRYCCAQKILTGFQNLRGCFMHLLDDGVVSRLSFGGELNAIIKE
jgi:hypothetical protein